MCVARDVRYDDIDDFIEEWHGNPDGKELHEHLGMTWQEYALWVVDASILPMIVSLRRQNRSLDDVLQEFADRLPGTGRPAGLAKTRELIDWLKRQHTSK
jgi:hypothetical protein